MSAENFDESLMQGIIDQHLSKWDNELRPVNGFRSAMRTRSHMVTSLRVFWRGLPAVLRGAALVYFAHGCSQHGGEWAAAFQAWGW